MNNDELIIKNDALAATLKRVISERDSEPVFEGKTASENGEYLVCTYAMDMFYSGMEAGVFLDFTYGTLKELPKAVASCYRRNRRDVPESSAVSGTAKAIAAYFYTVAMNEHDLTLDVSPMNTVPGMVISDAAPVWGIYRIRIGKKKSDFLLSVSEGCRTIGLGGKRVLIYDLGALTRDYRTATGVDLKKYDVPGIAFDI